MLISLSNETCQFKALFRGLKVFISPFNSYFNSLKLPKMVGLEFVNVSFYGFYFLNGLAGLKPIKMRLHVGIISGKVSGGVTQTSPF